MACVKIYLCSNPDDSVMERKVLRENAFPRIRDHCRRKHGVDFRVIDPYEDPNPDKWPTQQVRLQLIEECRQNSLGPFFVSLVGVQYGAACLPEQVEFSEFLTVLQVCQEMGFRAKDLEQCYRQDENTIPPSFCLISQRVHHKYNSQPGQNVDKNAWNDVLAKGRKLLNDVITQCVLEGSIDQENAEKYFRSRLENDLRFALDGQSGSNIKRCLCYVYKTGKHADQRKKENYPEDQDQLFRLSQLCDNFLPNLVRTKQALIYTTTNNRECDDKQSYAEDLNHQLYSDLIGLIEESIVNERVQIHDSFSQQKNLCHVLSTLYRIERTEVSHIRAYLEQDTKYPFILIGGPCTGKSVLLAHCATQIQTWMKDQNPVVIAHFVDFKSSLKQILSVICHQIALWHSQQYNDCLKDVSQLKETLNNLLTTHSQFPNHLILIIDGLNQMHDTHRPLDLAWLPKKLPSNVKLLISSTPTKSGFLSAIKTYYPESSLFFDLQPVTSKSCSQMLTSLLLAGKRKITSGQQMYVNQAFKQCDLPLYVELLYRQVCYWGSDLEITPDTLVPGVHINIGRFLDHLEEKHGKLIVTRSLEYLTLSKTGLTEGELTDILSCDDEVLLTFLPADNYAPYKLRVPEVVVEMLLLDLRGFLKPQNILGTQTLFWVNRHFILVICKRYLCQDNQQKLHSLIANYFSGHWACGTSKPLLIASSPSQNVKPLKIYADRQVPGQPWTFQPFTSAVTSSGSSECAHPNLRKLQELPYHLLKSGNTEELVRIMMSHEFLNAMICAELVDELVFWLEKTSQIVFSRELRLLISILKSTTCLLRNCSADFALVMQAKLIPFFKVLPELKESVNLAGHDDSVGRLGVNMLLCPTPSVPATHWAVPEVEVSPITKAAVSQSGYVVVIQSNGSVWSWNESDSEGYKVSQSSELQFTDVICSANVFILSTQSGNLLSLDMNAPTYLQKLQTQQTEQPIKGIEGLLMASGKTFVFSKDSNSVRVFTKGTEITPFHCSSGITCMSTCDGHRIYCGQNEGTVSIFDSQSGSLLASFVCSLGTALCDLIVHKNEATITCIDCTGSVFVWDLKNIKKPIFITMKENCNKKEVLNIDHIENNLLICKRQQIHMIHGYLLAVEEQFNAPKSKTFVQAILDQDAHFIIALMENCPSLLIWNWVSGQCLLNLDIRSSHAFKLVKFGDTFLTAVTTTGIVIWDMDLISLAASTPKSGGKVLKVIVEPDEEHFYTSDGSEQVWRWSVLGGKVKGNLLHQGPVESLTLSSDSVYLVTIASGDIYVWNTSTPENIYRIHGSQASHILITPKGHFAVSFSETGLSKVWKLCNGHVICTIHHYLRDAVITGESTFLLGINEGALLAVSLWSGYVSKQFFCSDWPSVAAFQVLSDYPDYVIVITSSGALYSWRLTENTVCHQFQFLECFEHPPQLFKLSSDGRYGVISVDGSKINVLDLCQGKLCSVNAEGPVCQPFVDILGKYIVYICSPGVKCQNYSCDLHTKQMLVIIQVTNGKMVGKFYLCKNVTALTLSKRLCVYIGFEDGAVGVYAINDTDVGYANANAKCHNTELICPFEEPVVWLPLPNPNLTWAELL
ncbi:NACHT and WD repeat domain-containing protein 2 [Tachysurus vachellii]|uniref:NACHT and WD repeat domain-containing protein 2 n=1 Tax=Tachysurus vachellii TaxID=175792 RepID=UPI00296B12F7|nr:NACHT and WD repeat domain-containing protein 2 [Tachysurus vachellii]